MHRCIPECLVGATRSEPCEALALFNVVHYEPRFEACALPPPTPPPWATCTPQITQAMLSNVGGTATQVGDPPNIIIGNVLRQYIGFVDFIINLAPGRCSFWTKASTVSHLCLSSAQASCSSS